MSSAETTAEGGQQKFRFDFPESGYFHCDLEKEDDLWENDALNRKSVADFLTNLVKGQGEESSLVISVHGEWGSGKTFLLSRWACQLKRQQVDKANQRHCAIYFNAWEDDFQADPLIAIIGQLSDALIGYPSLKSLITPIIKSACAVAAKEVYRHTGIDIKSCLKYFKSKDRAMFDEYLHVRENLETLKDNLLELAHKIQQETNHPLVFIIDEIDRCRPIFAIQLLERVKHILSVPGIVFVFGINKTELAKSVQSVYGSIDGEDYLRRFFGLDLVMPPASPSDYCNYLLEKHRILERIRGSRTLSRLGGRQEYWNNSWPDGMGEFLPYLADCAQLSLRQIDSSVRLLSMVLHCREMQGEEKPMHIMEGYRVIVLVLLKLKNFELYQDFIRGKCEIKDVVKYIISLFYDEDKNAPKTFFKPQKDLIGSLYSFVPHEKADDCRSEYQEFRKVLGKHVTALPPAPELIQREIGNLKYIPGNIHSWELLNDLDQVIMGNVHQNERHKQSWLGISGNSSLTDIIQILELGSV